MRGKSEIHVRIRIDTAEVVYLDLNMKYEYIWFLSRYLVTSFILQFCFDRYNMEIIS